MPKYNLKLDGRRRITLPEPIADGIGKELYLAPNTVTALIYSKDVPLQDIIHSTELLLQALKHQLILQQKEKQKKNPS